MENNLFAEKNMKFLLDRTVTVRFIIFVVKAKNKTNRGEFMGKILFLIAVIGIKILFCKGVFLGIVLLLFWIKGKKLKFNSEKWEQFFLQMPVRTIQQYVIAIYITAAGISSAVSYFMIETASYQHSLAIAVLIFTGGAAVTAYRWHRKGKTYLRNRYQATRNTILSQRSGEKNEHE